MNKLLSLTLCLWLWGFSAFAQSALEITVVDRENGSAIPDIELIVQNESIGFTETAVTDSQGKVRFSNLSTTGSYRVTIPESGEYYGISSDPLQLRSNTTRSITMVTASKSTVELDEITVNAPITRINTINAEVASELSSDELESLPVQARDINTALYRLPNVTPATGFFPEAPNVSINGANGLYTNYLIDGMDNNEQFLGGPQFEVPTGMVKDVTVLTSTYSAEYGRTGNGIFNVTTKSGGNTVEGEAFYLTRPGPPLDASSPFAQRDLSGNAVKNGFERHQAGFAVGGPIVEDQTFYFVNVEHTTDWKDNVLRVPELDVTESIQGQNHFTYASGKIDHRWTD